MPVHRVEHPTSDTFLHKAGEKREKVLNHVKDTTRFELNEVSYRFGTGVPVKINGHLSAGL